MSKKPRKATRIEKGILLAVVWLARDKDEPNTAVNLAKSYGVHNLDVSDHAELDLEVYAELNEYSGMSLKLADNKERHARERVRGALKGTQQHE